MKEFIEGLTAKIPATTEKQDASGKKYTAFVIVLQKEDKSINQNHTTYTVHKRFSALHKFHTSVSPLVAAAGLSKLSSDGTLKRQQQLETYLSSLISLCHSLSPPSISPIITKVSDFLEIQEHVSPGEPQAANDPHKYDLERKNKLMEATSVVSKSLIRVYFLDCTFRTVKFNSDTTVRQVSAKISPHLPLAMFEVESDVRVSSQLRLLSSHEHIETVVKQWESGGLERAKFVMPVTSIDDTLINGGGRSMIRDRATTNGSNPFLSADRGTGMGTHGGSTRSTGMTMASVRSTDFQSVATSPNQSVMTDSSYLSGGGASPRTPSAGESMAGVGGSSVTFSFPTTPSSAVRGGGGGGGEFEEKFRALQEAHEKLQAKFDNLKNITKKRGREKIPGVANPGRSGGGGGRRDSAPTLERGASSSSNTEVSSQAPQIHLCGWLKKQTDITRVWNDRYLILKTNGDLSYYYSEPRNGEQGDAKYLCNLRDVERVLRGSRETSFTLVTSGARIMLQADSAEVFRQWFHGLQKLREVLLSGGWGGDAGTEDVQVNLDGENSAEDEVEEEIDPAVNLFFHTNQFADSESKKITAMTFIDNVSIVDEFFDKFDRDYMTQAFSQAANSADHLMQAYEVVSAMQVLHTNLLDLGERWSGLFRKWLLHSLKTHMTLPVQRPDLLMAVVQCMSCEHMLHSSETVKEVEKVIETCLGEEEEGREEEDGGGEGSSYYEAISNDLNGSRGAGGGTEVDQLLKTVKGMVGALFMVVDDLVPMLPPDFNVLALFQKAAEERINRKVSIFYSTHKDNLDVNELLSLLSWADNHKHVMERFGIYKLSKEFLSIERDLYLKYENKVSSLQMLFQGRIITNDIHHEISTLHGGAKVSSWPQDLMVCVESQLQIALSRLQGASVDKICALCIGLLTFFHKELLGKMRDEGMETMSVERMCVYANDCYRFSDRLQEQTSSFDGLTEEAADKLADKISEIITLFSETSMEAINGIVGVMCCEVKKEIQTSLFDGEEGAVGGGESLANMKNVVRQCAGDVRRWLCDESLIANVLKLSLNRIIKFYLECLLDARPRLDEAGEVLAQIKDDGEAILDCFGEFEDLLPREIVERDVEVVLQVIQLCQVDVEGIVDFWMSKLVKSFGSSSTRVVECVLLMRSLEPTTRKTILTEMKLLKNTHGSALIHDEKCGCLLSLSSIQARKRDMVKDAMYNRGKKKREFLVRRNSSQGHVTMAGVEDDEAGVGEDVDVDGAFVGGVDSDDE
ncbi:hypothetical protein TrLO_g5995 [Triparma laevis f. longispina]|uniref:PH domain-containing protein n=1 Tax=Triparma laevis f. longispina TaxID=1714387 RepID=A0A9W7C6P0_9STRA|nr:hypothetical protein TrLO_g5995 [Triparma laevis f. longispina]